MPLASVEAVADDDGDGVCDDIDDCVGQIDECGVCNGPGAIYDCGCEDIPEGDCDCDGNQLMNVVFAEAAMRVGVWIPRRATSARQPP